MATVGARDYLQKKGYTVGWNPDKKQVTAALNGQTVSFSPTSNIGGKTYAPQSTLDQIVSKLSSPVISKPDALSRNLQVTLGNRSEMLPVGANPAGNEIDAITQKLSQPGGTPGGTPGTGGTTGTPGTGTSGAADKEVQDTVTNAINQAAGVNSTFNPQQQYSDPNFINQLVARLTGIMDPATQSARRNINQSYDLGNQRMLENLNARGVLRGDIGQGDLDRYEQQRQQSLMDIDAQTQSQALAQALNFAQLPMQEREMLFNEFNSNRGFDASQLWNRAQMLAGQTNDDRNYGLGVAGLTGNFNGTPTLAAQNQQFNQGLGLAGLTGYYNGAPTMARENSDRNYNDPQNAMARSLAEKFMGGGALTPDERAVLGLPNESTKEQVIEGIFAKIQSGQSLSPTEQKLIGTYSEPRQVATKTPEQQYRDSIYGKLQSGQLLTAEERQIIGVKEQTTQNNIIQEAIQFAQRDPDFEIEDEAGRQEIINYYIQLLGGQVSGTPRGELSDDDLAAELEAMTR